MGNMLMVFLSPLTTVCIFQNQDSRQHNCHTINQTWNLFIFSNYLSKEPFPFWSKMPPRIMLCIWFCLFKSRRVSQPFPAFYILNVFKEYRSFILGDVAQPGCVEVCLGSDRGHAFLVGIPEKWCILLRASEGLWGCFPQGGEVNLHEVGVCLVFLS